MQSQFCLSTLYQLHHPHWYRLIWPREISAGSKVKSNFRHKYSVKHRLSQGCGSNFDLIIRDVRFHDADHYSCVVDRSRLYHLTVVERPTCRPISTSTSAIAGKIEGAEEEIDADRDNGFGIGLFCFVAFVQPPERYGKFQPSVSWRDRLGARITKDVEYAISVEDLRTEITLTLWGNASFTSGARCFVSDSTLSVYPSSERIHLHNAGLSAKGELAAGFQTPAALSALVSDSCERRPLQVECPENVEIDLDHIKARYMRESDVLVRAMVNETVDSRGKVKTA